MRTDELKTDVLQYSFVLQKASAYAKIITDLFAVKIVKNSGKVNKKLEYEILVAAKRMIEIEEG